MVAAFLMASENPKLPLAHCSNTIMAPIDHNGELSAFVKAGSEAEIGSENPIF